MWNILAVILYVSQLSCLKITPREKGDLPAACRLFSRGVIFTRARVSLPLISLKKNGGLLVVYFYGYITNSQSDQP